MRFCMITTFYPPCHFGGDATYVRALAQGLGRRGHQVEVVHCLDAYRLKSRKPVPDAISEPGVKVHSLASRVGALSPLLTQQTGHPVLKSSRLRSILAQPFDVVHFHNISLIGGPAVLRLSHAPVTLWTLHEHWLLCPTHVFWKNRRQACERPQCVQCCLRSGVPPQLWRYTSLPRRAAAGIHLALAPSAYTAERHLKWGFGAPIAILPLFSALAPDRSDLGPARQSGRFLYVGRITASKGIGALAEEFATLPFELVVVGDGDQKAELERRFRDAPNVRFLGQLPQNALSSLYRDATALILPSLAPESFGLAVVEASAFGTPAIIRAAGAAQEIIQMTGGGIVYRSSGELRAAIHELAANAELRDRLAARARAGFLEYYTEDRHLAAYLKHVAAVAAQRRPIERQNAGDPYVPQH